MTIIKRVVAKDFLNSRKEKTIFISVITKKGKKFSATSPLGKSIGKHEKKMYRKNLENDIKIIKKMDDYFSKEIIEKFDDLRRIEDIVDGHIGANTLFALESAVLKAMADEQKKQVWQLIKSKSDIKKFPRLVGNCIGGGKHSQVSSNIGSIDNIGNTDSTKKTGRKPDFQEFLIIPELTSVKESQIRNKEIKKSAEFNLKKQDKNFKSQKNDEDAWITRLKEKEVLDILKEFNIPLGIDIASSEFYKRGKYHYLNPRLERSSEEQFEYISNLIKNYNLFYLEDPFHEDDFENFSRLLKKFPKKLIVGDDLTVTNLKRMKKAIQMKSINAIIVKPNQNGSLIEVKQVCKLAKENNIKIIFSHRSGETDEKILADLAFGFGADFFKCGITGKEREAKLKRLIAIEESFKRNP